MSSFIGWGSNYRENSAQKSEEDGGVDPARFRPKLINAIYHVE